ncbi:MAG TPA: AAA family ATPase [Firmicutes bacterium]|nr:AAA family ATPase [Bacillota bacterium]
MGYHFQMESILSVLDDIPAEVEIDGKLYRCQIISVKGLEVYLALEQNLGPQITEAIIRTNLWFLLELLCKKYEEAESAADSMFKTSRHLFAGRSKAVAVGEPPRYELYPDPPNESQKCAIEASFSRTLAVIWGPPGTGKTRTIAKAVEAHLNAGRRVLLVSHANTAVDRNIFQFHQGIVFFQG